jgi:hypothetical protein
MHTPEIYQRSYKSGSTIVAQELTRNNMEVAGLIVYFFALAMVFTIFAILMLFGSGVVTDTQASLKSKLPGLVAKSAQDSLHSPTTT